MENKDKKIEIIPKRMDKHLIRKKLVIINCLLAIFIGLVLLMIIVALTI